MDDNPARRQADELVRIVTSAVRECWEAYALQFGDGDKPTRAGIDAVLARSAYPILAAVDDMPADLRPVLVPHVVRAMLTAFLQVTQEALGREHRRMLDTLETEALRFADRANRAIDEAGRARARDVARLQDQVDRLRREIERGTPP
ncbi:MAG TPA: hypothetical protein VMT79_02005 [Candidatus Binatia bacterium]|nr:hypothetical protein [Candidatus Binatia bacterium]